MRSATPKPRLPASLTLTLAAAALVFVGATGCQGQTSDDVGNGGTTKGRTSLTLLNDSGESIAEFDWLLLSSSREIISSGKIMTDPLTGELSLDLFLPVGSGSRLRMEGRTAQGTHCAGESQPFNVVAGQLASLDIPIVCDGSKSGAPTGEVRITTTLVSGDHCPTLNAWSVAPTSVNAEGGEIDIFAVASDVDQEDVLTYQWSVDEGDIVDAHAAHTQYVCGPTGWQTLRLTLSDNRQPVACVLQVAFPPVECLSARRP